MLLQWINEVFSVADFDKAKAQLLTWASGFGSCAFFDNNQYASDFHTHECLVALGSYAAVTSNADGSAFVQLQRFIDRYQGNWLFGHLGYGLRAETESISSIYQQSFEGFTDLHFFVPEIVIHLRPGKAVIESLNEQPDILWRQIMIMPASTGKTNNNTVLQPLLTKEQYLQKVQQLQQHIQRGDCYEINFCLPFMAQNILLNPISVFEKLCQVSPMPFACFYRQQQQYLLCASPERFLQKSGNRISSQPMKGTSPRHTNPGEDALHKTNLQNSRKEKSENVMIADLVRNDLSKICKEGSVQAEALFNIQTYPQVYQMVSTISGELQEGVSFTDIIRATFPMGSMTGAPKKRVMELIDTYEPLSRGLFSGSVGYIDPAGNFDFNVVIRSLLYNAETQRLQYFAGSAITFYSHPEEEYKEVMLKTKAVRTILEEE